MVAQEIHSARAIVIFTAIAASCVNYIIEIREDHMNWRIACDASLMTTTFQVYYIKCPREPITVSRVVMVKR